MCSSSPNSPISELITTHRISFGQRPPSFSMPVRRSTMRSSTSADESDSASSSSSCADLRADEDGGFFNQKNDSVSSIAPSIAHNDDTTMSSSEVLRPKENTHILPPEILIAIFSRLSAPQDLLNCMKMSKRWGRNSVELLWHRPVCNSWDNLKSVANAVVDPRSYYPYADLIRRLNLSSLADQINDGTLQPFERCKRIERLTLTNCSQVTDQGIMNIVKGSSGLLALDITGLHSVSDNTIEALADNCPRLQGLNITGCRKVTDWSLVKLAKACKYLKRLKFNKCTNITDLSVLAFANNCPYLLEVDLQECRLITDTSVTALLANGRHLRELRLAQCQLITDEVFYHLDPHIMFDSLRILDLTACSFLHDSSVERIIDSAPRLRILVLAKCVEITDRAVIAICKLGKNLHDIHLGRCQQITDNALKELVKCCNRIRYIDLAGCSRVTDASVKMLAGLPKLRRIGLVKCQEITDRSIVALARGSMVPDPRARHHPASNLERVHLSYCVNITLQGIHTLLTLCPKLTHLSLTGIQAFFTRQDITRFCREAPPEFNDDQRTLFCVFSGEGVNRLRHYLNMMSRDPNAELNVNPLLHPDVDGPEIDADAERDGNDDEGDILGAGVDHSEESESSMLVDNEGGVAVGPAGQAMNANNADNFDVIIPRNSNPTSVSTFTLPQHFHQTHPHLQRPHPLPPPPPPAPRSRQHSYPSGPVMGAAPTPHDPMQPRMGGGWVEVIKDGPSTARSAPVGGHQDDEENEPYEIDEDILIAAAGGGTLMNYIQGMHIENSRTMQNEQAQASTSISGLQAPSAPRGQSRSSSASSATRQRSAPNMAPRPTLFGGDSYAVAQEQRRTWARSWGFAEPEEVVGEENQRIAAWRWFNRLDPGVPETEEDRARRLRDVEGGWNPHPDGDHDMEHDTIEF
ncbi:SCF ubiquitin ligase complex subunit [Agyrium rufum]|nr:SCF ubiquitin ligase complex subunit [Agyrium rufum]